MGSGRINTETANTHLEAIEGKFSEDHDYKTEYEEAVKIVAENEKMLGAQEAKNAKKPNEQLELDFGARYKVITDKERDKNVVAFLKLLDKFNCSATTVNYIMILIEPTEPRIKCCQKEPEK